MNRKLIGRKDPIPAIENQHENLIRWAGLGAVTLLCAYFYVFMEWLFYITKPSFMDFMPIITKAGILLLSGLLLSLISLPVLLILLGLNFLSSRLNIGIARRIRAWNISWWMGAVLPAAFLTSTALLMLDNFTYTLFKIGVVTTTGVWRGIYGLLFLLLLVGCAGWVGKSLLRKNASRGWADPSLKAQLLACAALLVISIPIGSSLYLSSKTQEAAAVVSTAEKRPNILLIGSDGVNAEHMSLYGYERDTTPFLELAQTGLLAENNFTNSSVTAGSLVSMFTGKLPIQTRVLYPPDILKGADAFQHLPGILKNQGYYNAEISVDYYADATVLNLQDSFVMVNDRSETISRLYTFTRSYMPENAAYFLSTIARRISDRVFHIYYIHTMPNPYSETTTRLNAVSDEKRVEQILSLFQNIQQPLFIHAHLMGTHDGILSPRKNVFFKDKDITPDNILDYYDDAILSYDEYMESIINGLKKLGKLDQTVIIVYSDHGMHNVSNVRLPLMFRFPNGEIAGKVSHSTQNLDIAPTVLDYMGITPPAWMAGASLLQGEPSTNRPIFSAAPNFRAKNELDLLQLDLSKIKPPFYQFGTFGMVICQNWYALDTASLAWSAGEVQGYTAPCQPDSLPDARHAQQILLEQLKADGFDVSTVENSIKSGSPSKP